TGAAAMPAATSLPAARTTTRTLPVRQQLQRHHGGCSVSNPLSSFTFASSPSLAAVTVAAAACSTPTHRGARVVSSPSQRVRNGRRHRRLPLGRPTGTAGEWPPATHPSRLALAAAESGRGLPPGGRVRI